MAVEKKFLQKRLEDIQVKDFLKKELDKAGVSSIEIQKTPVATRIFIKVRRPGAVVGRKGSGIKAITETLTKQFHIENPQIEIIEVGNSSLDPQLVAEKIGRSIEAMNKVKQVMRFTLNDVMNAGAIGCEIRIAGKVQGKGAKAKAIKVRQGYLKKSGEPVKLVKVGKYVSHMKAGAIGILVKIVPPGTIFPDKINMEKARMKQEQPKAEEKVNENGSN
ncbi:30S ribosomal protein S3 [uncultured archaeon]|nr:30S ribosomal protein S3 [uncultured archaeon]